jgi:hypothetical protein
MTFGPNAFFTFRNWMIASPLAAGVFSAGVFSAGGIDAIVAPR